MGELINLNSAPLIDADIPAAIARDTEVSAAIAAHSSAISPEPHSMYLTQARGDARYRRSTVALADADIPATIARDTEVSAAIAAHSSAISPEPHSMYLTQARGDARYALSKVISITTLADPTRGFGTPHGLNFSKICGYTGIIESAPTTGSLISPNNDSNSGFRYSINCDAQNIYFLPATTYNSGLASKPLRFIIFYLP